MFFLSPDSRGVGAKGVRGGEGVLEVEGNRSGGQREWGLKGVGVGEGEWSNCVCCFTFLLKNHILDGRAITNKGPTHLLFKRNNLI